MYKNPKKESVQRNSSGSIGYQVALASHERNKSVERSLERKKSLEKGDKSKKHMSQQQINENGPLNDFVLMGSKYDYENDERDIRNDSSIEKVLKNKSPNAKKCHHHKKHRHHKDRSNKKEREREKERESTNISLMNIKDEANEQVEDKDLYDLKPDDVVYNNSMKISKFIAESEQAKVYLGYIKEVNCHCILKRYILTSYDYKLADNMYKNSEFLRNIKHPSLIKYYDVVYTKQLKFCTMDFLSKYNPGLNLADFMMMKKDQLTPDLRKSITKQILEGLVVLHENAIIHRDLKPENIYIPDNEKQIYILDYGVCTLLKDNQPFLRKRTLTSSPWYLSPEVILDKPYSYDADIWSVGCLIYEMTCGKKPYADINPYNSMIKMTQHATPIEDADESVKDIFYDRNNRSLLDFLQKCWRPNNNFRPNAKELLEHKYFA